MDFTETKIIKAIETADTETLVGFFSKDIMLALPDFDDFADKETASKELNKFFAQYPPEKFMYKHKGVSKTGKGRYVVGELKTANQVFRVNFYILEEVIQEFSIYPKPDFSS